MNKLKKISKKDVKNDEKVKEVLFNYFSRIGLYYPTNAEIPLTTPAGKANFFVKWGKDQFRRDAWAMVRTELKDTLPPELFAIYDSHYGPKGTAKAIINEFTLEERFALCEIVVNSPVSSPEMKKVAGNALKNR